MAVRTRVFLVLWALSLGVAWQWSASVHAQMPAVGSEIRFVQNGRSVDGHTPNGVIMANINGGWQRVDIVPAANK